MKKHSAHLQFCLWLAVCLPLPSHAEIAVPYWINPKWLMAKVLDFHVRNAERYEQVQVLAQAKTTSNVSVNVSSSDVTNVATGKDQNQRKTNLAPVENATVKINEKQLSKEELMELRKQLRQKP
jgi:hypothetical protein